MEITELELRALAAMGAVSIGRMDIAIPLLRDEYTVKQNPGKEPRESS